MGVGRRLSLWVLLYFLFLFEFRRYLSFLRSDYYHFATGIVPSFPLFGLMEIRFYARKVFTGLKPLFFELSV